VPACCPRCASTRVARAHTRWQERPRCWLTGRVPYRCSTCRWRGWQIVVTERRHHLRIRSFAVVLVLVVSGILGGVFGILRYGVKSAGNVRAGQSFDGPVLSILSTGAHQSLHGDVWYVDGEIQNLTEHPLTNVQVVVTWFDRAGVVLATDVSLVDLERLTPRGISVYRTTTHAVKGMSRFELQFQSDLGQVLSAQGERQGTVDTSATTERNADVAPASGALSSEPVPPP
jgi:hypothetical protein